MLKEILEQRGLSVYKLSQDTGISYSTLNDIVIEKTDIKNTSANTLYRIAKYLDLSMETLYENSLQTCHNIYLYNEGRNIILEFEDKRIQFLGPKNLLSFHKINKIVEHVIYVDCYFEDEDKTIYTEEDYIDLMDALSDASHILDSLYYVKLGTPNTSAKQRLIDEAILISDSIAILTYDNPDIPDDCVEAVCLARPNSKAVIRLKDYAIILSSMSKAMQNRAIEAVKRNIEEIEEVRKYA